MTKKKLKWILMLTSTVFFIGALVCLILLRPGAGKSMFAPVVWIDQNKLNKVTDIVDGDTFKVNIDGKNITVRMFGINTPETVDPCKPAGCYGKEASDETKRLLHGAEVVLKPNPKREAGDICCMCMSMGTILFS